MLRRAKQSVIAEYTDSQGDTWIADIPVHGNCRSPCAVASEAQTNEFTWTGEAALNYDPDEVSEGPVVREGEPTQIILVD